MGLRSSNELLEQRRMPRSQNSVKTLFSMWRGGFVNIPLLLGMLKWYRWSCTTWRLVTVQNRSATPFVLLGCAPRFQLSPLSLPPDLMSISLPLPLPLAFALALAPVNPLPIPSPLAHPRPCPCSYQGSCHCSCDSPVPPPTPPLPRPPLPLPPALALTIPLHLPLH